MSKEFTLEDANLYNMNKSLLANEKALDPIAYNVALGKIAKWLAEDRYFMLLCHEDRNYTLFNFINDGDFSKDRYLHAANELQECLNNRGLVISIEYQKNEDAWEIWINDGEPKVYYLFKYSMGVIEV